MEIIEFLVKKGQKDKIGIEYKTSEFQFNLNLNLNF